VDSLRSWGRSVLAVGEMPHELRRRTCRVRQHATPPSTRRSEPSRNEPSDLVGRGRAVGAVLPRYAASMLDANPSSSGDGATDSSTEPRARSQSGTRHLSRRNADDVVHLCPTLRADYGTYVARIDPAPGVPPRPRATARRSWDGTRYPRQVGLVAQGIEHRSPKAGVARSNRAGPTQTSAPTATEIKLAMSRG
jgi:hypothetical protein